MILAPEYGGDGKTIGRCSQFKDAVREFPGALRAGRFDVLHAHALSGEVSRRRVHDVAWLVEPRAVSDGGLQHPVPAGREGKEHRPARSVRRRLQRHGAAEESRPGAVARPNGTYVGPDGTMYITESVKGKIWRVVYRGK